MLRLGVAVALVCAPKVALGWTEAEPIEAELRATVDANGRMTGVYRVTISIDAGHFHGFDLDGLPERFTPNASASAATDERGAPVGVRFEAGRGGRLHVSVDTVRGEGKGRVVFDVAFTALADVAFEDGRLVVRVSTPPWDHGMNRTSISLGVPAPAAETEVVDGDLFDGITVDESGGAANVSVLRHRVPRWTPMTLAVRLPPERMPSVVRLPPRAPATKRAHVRAPTHRSSSAPFGSLALAVLPALLALGKWQDSARSARGAGVRTAPIVPFHPAARVVALALASIGGAVARADGRMTLAVTLLLSAGVLGALRYERLPEAAPGPGRWTRIEAPELRALVRSARRVRRRTKRFLDLTNLWGIPGVLFLCAAAAVAVMRELPRGLVPALSLGAALAAILIVPLLTATGPTLPLARVAEEARLLLATEPTVGAILDAEGGGGVGPIARFPEGSDLPDFVRLRVGPSVAPPGLRCLEVGVEHFGEHARPAALVRVVPGSAAEAALPGAPWARLVSPAADEVVALLRADTRGTRALFAAVRRALHQMHSAPVPSAVQVMPDGQPSGVPTFARSQVSPQFVAETPSVDMTHAPVAGAIDGHSPGPEQRGAQKPVPDPSASMQSASRSHSPS
jgi:hypothetical protein